MKYGRILCLMAFVAMATSARAEDPDRRRFLQICAAMVAVAAVGRPAPVLGLSDYVTAVEIRLRERGVANAAQIRETLSWYVWTEIQRQLRDIPDEENALSMTLSTTVPVGGERWLVQPRFRLLLGGYLQTTRGRERVVQSIVYLGGGEV